MKRSRNSLVFKHLHSCLNIALPLPEVMLSFIYLYCIWDIKKGFSSFTGLYISLFCFCCLLMTMRTNVLQIFYILNSSIGYVSC